MKKEAYNALIDISVAKFRWLQWQGKRLSYERVRDHLGGRDRLIAFLKEHCRGSQPHGFYGGNIPNATAKLRATQLLSMAGISPVEAVVRFHVTISGGVAPDVNPAAITRDMQWNKCRGFATRAEANFAAQRRYDYYVGWCKDAKNKPTNRVILTLFDKDGVITQQLSNMK